MGRVWVPRCKTQTLAGLEIWVQTHLKPILKNSIPLPELGWKTHKTIREWEHKWKLMDRSTISYKILKWKTKYYIGIVNVMRNYCITIYNYYLDCSDIFHNFRVSNFFFCCCCFLNEAKIQRRFMASVVSTWCHYYVER